MHIEFINHASLIVSSSDVHLIADPWLEGKVFHDGWALTSKSAMTFEDFKDITHIWFSHEHPDHFLPDNLKKIPKEYRQNIEVLFQETRDKKVVRYCKAAGFGKVTELRSGEWVQLGNDMRVMNCPCNSNWLADSWLCVRTSTGTLLNLNDCGAVDQLATIKELIGDVDVLATQFSYAQWVHNIEAVEQRLEHAREVLEAIRMQVEVLAPRYVIPFASFVWFCAEENFYLNAEKNDIRQVCDFIKTNTQAVPIPLYPGDKWIVGREHDLTEALARYELDASEIADPFLRPRTRRDLVDEKTLMELGQEYRRKLRTMADPSIVRLYLAWQSYLNRSFLGISRVSNLLRLIAVRVEPARLFVTDLGRAFTFDLQRGLQPADLTRSSCDIALPSASLAYCLEFTWGGETLYINGCFQENDDWKKVGSMIYPNRFFIYCNLVRNVDLGKDLSWRSAAHAAIRKVQMVKFARLLSGWSAQGSNYLNRRFSRES